MYIPAEKAKELYDTFYNEVCDVEAVDGGGWDNCTITDKSLKKVAKKCAQLAVDEILKSFDDIMDARKHFRSQSENEAVIFWLDVKNEIENL